MRDLLHANPPLWEVREGNTAEWDRYAVLLGRLAERALDGTGPGVRGAIRNLLWIEGHDSPEAGCRRVAQMLPAIDRFVARDELELLRFLDEISGLYPRCEAVAGWLARIRDGGLHPHVSRGVAEAAQLAHDCAPGWRDGAGPEWEAVWPGLVARLTRPNGPVRFYAARLLGQWYAVDTARHPSLLAVFDRITALDLARPGVAGPFLGPFYSGMDLPILEQATGVAVRDWVLHLLEHRCGPEPDTHPCSNGIDFFAHELLGTDEELVRLVRAGHIGIAAESAGDNGVDLCAVLRGMVDEPMPTARDVAAHLLVERGELSPGAEACGAVQRLPALDGAERRLLPPTTRDPDARTLLVVLPAPGQDALGDAAAWAALDATVPPALRGEVVRTAPTRWLGGATGVTFRNAAVTAYLVGPGGEAGWRRALLWSDIPSGFWG